MQGNDFKVLCKFASDLSNGPIEAIISIYYEKLFVVHSPTQSEPNTLHLEMEQIVKNTNQYFIEISKVSKLIRNYLAVLHSIQQRDCPKK